ncbi:MULTISPECIES: LEM-3-like GIY-YIG domain-containing protein [Enterobacteriaceae]|nr:MULTISPECIES: hypothetical protein [Enterobacteriaceae]HBR1055838.1 hypothetical protein [Klebsiella quasipneumoniae subsp. similipneumoniae]HBV3208100.1 hypothetical protein [Klebsiella pneumoniae]HCM9104145.1 hypothetical protein [Enterobacter hormaechei subsp. xiangfangensis]MDT9743384.1 hypothetical protein [Klebsiella quasipneumoniae]RDB39718.1 hypothetical protein DPX44_11205 [Enterobacter cloacae]
MNIKEFPPGVMEHLGWYVYRLIDPRDGSTFYVGKGKGNRVFAHMRGEVAAVDDDELLSNKLKQLREIRLAGLEVIHVIHRHGMTDEKTAYEVEAALIDAYPGLTNIMSGAGSNEYGPAHIKELIATYQPETVVFQHKVLMISVNRSSKDVDLYDAVRFSWRVRVERARKAEFILATVRGIVRGVYIADEWLESTRENFPEMPSWDADDEFESTQKSRFGFRGRLAPPDIAKIYLGKKIPDVLRKKGAMSPVKYSPDF